MIMKKMLFLLVGLFALTAYADNDRPMKVEDMPKEAQKFIQAHFAGRQVALAKMEKDFMERSYEVIFTNGDKVEFDKRGHWEEVDCEYSEVPTAVLPNAIQKYLAKHYPKAKVLKIEQTVHKGYEVELNNDFEIEFDKRFNVIDIDR